VRDDYLNYLNYQIKEEVINGYLRERMIIEEEKKEFSQKLAAFRQIEAAAGNLHNHLACLLVTPENVQQFFSLIGLNQPPLSRAGSGEITGRPPTCPAGLSPKGFTDRGRYLDLVIKTYNELWLLTRHGREEAEKLKALADEINGDIRTFSQNYDIMSIINFLKSMDVEMLIKKKFMGGNFSPDELTSIYHTMDVKPVNCGPAGIHAWPELPSPRKVKKRTTSFIYSVFKQYKEAIRPALH